MLLNVNTSKYTGYHRALVRNFSNECRKEMLNFPIKCLFTTWCRNKDILKNYLLRVFGWIRWENTNYRKLKFSSSSFYFFFDALKLTVLKVAVVYRLNIISRIAVVELRELATSESFPWVSIVAKPRWKRRARRYAYITKLHPRFLFLLLPL